jgi:hypothetical protein
MDPAEILRPGGDPALFIPMNNYDTYIHGGLDPGQDENVPLIPAVEVKESDKYLSKNGNDLFSSSDNGVSSGTSVLSYPSTGMFILAFISLGYPPDYFTRSFRASRYPCYVSSNPSIKLATDLIPSVQTRSFPQRLTEAIYLTSQPSWLIIY